MTNASYQPCIHRLCSGLAVSTLWQHPVASFHTKCRCIDCWWAIGTGNTNPAHPITYLSHLKAVYASDTMYVTFNFIYKTQRIPNMDFLSFFVGKGNIAIRSRHVLMFPLSNLTLGQIPVGGSCPCKKGRGEQRSRVSLRGEAGACWLHPAWTTPSRIFSQTPHTSVPPQALHAACPFLFSAWATHNWQCKWRFSFRSMKYSQEHHKLHASFSFS